MRTLILGSVGVATLSMVPSAAQAATTTDTSVLSLAIGLVIRYPATTTLVLLVVAALFSEVPDLLRFARASLRV